MKKIVKNNSKKNVAVVDSTASKRYSIRVNVKFIKTRRMSLGLTQTQAAKLAGWGQQHWADVENGKAKDPRIMTLAKVARVLSCKFDDLLIRPR